jgi:hypothetical protein
MPKYYIFENLGNGEFRRFEADTEAELQDTKDAMLANNEGFVIVPVAVCDEFHAVDYEAERGEPVFAVVATAAGFVVQNTRTHVATAAFQAKAHALAVVDRLNGVKR